MHPVFHSLRFSGGLEPMAWTTKVAVLACAITIISCAYVMYDLNGGSMDLSDREVILVISDSMDGDVQGFDIGSFPADTLVMIQHLQENELKFLKVGDVISYHSQNTLFHHRVVKVDSESVYVHGDNNHSTEKVYYSSINGKVVGTNWVLGHAVSFLSDNFYLFLVAMFVLCSGLIVYAVYSPGKAKKEVEC